MIPEIEAGENVDVEIKPDDLRIETFKSGGAGGQYVNKTESAVRIIHEPTGIIVASQQERSQAQNRDVAMNILRAKLVQRAAEERRAKLSELRGERQANEWGSQIRSYVLQPYQLVKDHRTNVETGNAEGVLDGHIDTFIWPYLQQRRTGVGLMRDRFPLVARAVYAATFHLARMQFAIRSHRNFVDFGIFAQTIASAFGCFCNPIEGSHWAFHFSPILYLVGAARSRVALAARALRRLGRRRCTCHSAGLCDRCANGDRNDRRALRRLMAFPVSAAPGTDVQRLP